MEMIFLFLFGTPRSFRQGCLGHNHARVCKNANRKTVQGMRTNTGVGVETPHVVRTLPGNFQQVDEDND